MNTANQSLSRCDRWGCPSCWPLLPPSLCSFKKFAFSIFYLCLKMFWKLLDLGFLHNLITSFRSKQSNTMKNNYMKSDSTLWRFKIRDNNTRQAGQSRILGKQGRFRIWDCTVTGLWRILSYCQVSHNSSKRFFKNLLTLCLYIYLSVQ